VGGVTEFLLVGVGGVAGTVARHALGERVETGTVGTLAVNVIGSFALGALVALPAGESTLLVAGTGFCGAFTTFSTFAFETVRLYERGRGRRAALNGAVNLVGAVLTVATGGALASLV
jgi:CrcB protein